MGGTTRCADRVLGAVKALVATVLVVSALVVVTPRAGASAALNGRVVAATGPLEGFEVSLHATDPAGGEPILVGTAITDASGTFTVDHPGPVTDPDPDVVFYVTARPGGSSPVPDEVVLAGVLGPAPIPGDVVVNERTTVAAAFAMAQFAGGGRITGTRPGLQNAAGMAGNLVDVSTGAPSAVLTTPPNGEDAQRPLHSVANMVAACVAGQPACLALLDAARTPGVPAVVDTFAAVVDIARHPWNRVDELFAVALLAPAPYVPALAAPPDAWTLPLRFWGDGSSMSGPGNFAIDHEGYVWVTTNYTFDADPLAPVCGSDLLVRFTPTGRYAPGSPYTGGGLSGAGFGIDIDPFGDVWVGNFGFAAPGCPDQPPHNSVSQFRADGSPVSPSDGYTQGGISFPQGTVSDDEGNIWVANCGPSTGSDTGDGTDTVTIYPAGDPTRARQVGGLGLEHAFDIAHNDRGQAFVTGVRSNNVAVIESDGTPSPISPIEGGGLQRPLGIAADSQGNLWVANSSLIDLPCPYDEVGDYTGGSLTLIHADGTQPTASGFTGGGLTVPWGVAIDGNDNVWVANFAGRRVSQFCGMRVTGCRPGAVAGDPISPDGGYGFDGLTRNTGVAIDPSGNVWVANNWKEVAVQTNPGGYEVVVLVGAAAPVTRPAPRPRSEPGPTTHVPVPATSTGPPATAVSTTPRFSG